MDFKYYTLPQVTLRTFFFTLYALLLGVVVSYFLYTYHQYKHQRAQLTSQRAIAIIHALENSIRPLASVDQLSLLTLLSVPRLNTERLSVPSRCHWITAPFATLPMRRSALNLFPRGSLFTRIPLAARFLKIRERCFFPSTIPFMESCFRGHFY